MEIKGAVALVSGGASGLGEATVRELVGAGMKAVIADRDAKKGEALCQELGDAARFVQTDVSKEEDVQAAVDKAVSMGELRAVVSCAGIGFGGRTVDRDGAPHDLKTFQLVVGVNLIGTFNMVRLGAAAMAKNAPDDDGQRGAIVNTASVAAFEGQIGQAAYSASKGGVVGMNLPVARDLAKVGIRCNVVCPGTMDTPLLAQLPESARQALAATIPFPSRLGKPSEYAAVARHLLENNYINGETIRVDGALRMAPK